MVRISLHGGSKPSNVYTLQTLVNHKTPLILEEEPIVPFVPYPHPFLAPIWVPCCDNGRFRKFANQILTPSYQPSSTSHHLDLIEDNLEWFMEHKVKANHFFSQDDINVHNFSIESDLDTYHILSSVSHDPFSLDLLDKSLPNPSIDLQQDSDISQVEEKQGEDSFNISSLYQNPPCQDNVISSLVNFTSSNLGSDYNEIYFHNQYDVLDNHNPDDSESIIVCDDVFAGVPFDLLVSQE